MDWLSPPGHGAPRVARRRTSLLVAVLALAALLAGACSGAGDALEGEPAAAPSTSTSEPTTTAPPSTSTTAPSPFTALPGDAPVAALRTPTGVVVPVLGGGEGAWTVRTPCGGTATVGAGEPLRGAHVVLDAGHGGDEPGAVGPGGLTEKELNLAVVGVAREALEAAGAEVVLTRAGDYRVTLASRAEIAEALDPVAFVSVHFNADPDGPSEHPGTETYRQITSDESRQLSGLVYEEVVATLAPLGLSWVADTDAGAKYREGSRGDYYGILRLPAGVPTVLAELGFISNGAEEQAYRDPAVQQALGRAVAAGVVRFARGEQPGPVFTEPYPREAPAGSGGGSRGCTDPPLS